ncbi:MAG: hypothetical protein SFW09_20340 [Hyphomicrobiaceae bacterium]|nr:hypothetical protein [Hyphomicrobiaceae bacterium]
MAGRKGDEMKGRAVGLAVLTVWAGSASAEPGAAGGEALKKMIAGRTIVLDTPIGGVPITYRADGSLAGKASSVQAIAIRKSDHGRWWIADSKLCQQWAVWLDGKRHCYAMRIDGRLVHWRRDDGRTGTARIVSN